MTEPQITRLTEATPDSLSAVNRLLPQLSTHAQPLTLEELQAIADHSCLFLLVALPACIAIAAFSGTHFLVCRHNFAL